MVDAAQVRQVGVRVLRRSPPVWRTVRAVRQRLNAALPPRRIDGIPGPVHRNDRMLRATGRHRYHHTAVEGAAVDVTVDEALIEGHQDLWVCRVTR